MTDEKKKDDKDRKDAKKIDDEQLKDVAGGIICDGEDTCAQRADNRGIGYKRKRGKSADFINKKNVNY